jgi:CDP-diacylglycerol--glycerol-3-phosphate 3-phosphatidyltransferase
VLQLNFPYVDIVEWTLVYIALVLTIVSLVDYIWKNRGVMRDCK